MGRARGEEEHPAGLRLTSIAGVFTSAINWTPAGADPGGRVPITSPGFARGVSIGHLPEPGGV
jgi:hypothetical protein